MVVRFGLVLIQILNVDEKAQVFEMKVLEKHVSSVKDQVDNVDFSEHEWLEELDQRNRKQWVQFPFPVSDQCEHFCTTH